MKCVIIISVIVLIMLVALLFCTVWRDRIVAVFYLGHMERESRVSAMKVEKIMESLDLKPGYRVADIGAGSGLFSRRIAEKVLPDGMVFSVDINDELLKHISRSGIENIKTVLAEEDDPRIPEPVDLIFICDTLHYIDRQEDYVKAMSSYLKAGGRVAVIDFRENWPPVSVKFTEEDLRRWMESAGLELTGSYDFIRDEFFTVFTKR